LPYQTVGAGSGSLLLTEPSRREVDDCGAGFQSELLPDLCPVTMHRLEAEVQGLRDLVSFLSLADEAEHFEFPVGQVPDW
jgi:hypothetical protein